MKMSTPRYGLYRPGASKSWELGIYLPALLSSSEHSHSKARTELLTLERKIQG